MTDPKQSDLSRRRFLQASLAGATVLATGSIGHAQSADAVKEAVAPAEGGAVTAGKPLPTKPLGKTGVNVPILSIGGNMNAHSPQYLDMAWAMGVRYFDTAQSYNRGQSEKNVGGFLEKYPERRKELFLVSKCSPHEGAKGMLTAIDDRLAACKTDYLDLFFIHGLEPDFGGMDLPKSDELKGVIEQLKKSNKIKFFGFSCHHPQKAQLLAAAAEGGFIDAIMVQNCPVRPRAAEFEKALDACAKAGIGLISMKNMAPLRSLPARIPELDKLNLTARQGVLHAVWSDDRFAAACSQMNNVEEIKMNTEAGRAYEKPLDADTLNALKTTASACAPSMCTCGSCSVELACGTQLALHDISRFVTYYERGEVNARDMYRALRPEQRTAAGANLDAASAACLCGMDYASIVSRAERYFA